MGVTACGRVGEELGIGKTVCFLPLDMVRYIYTKHWIVYFIYCDHILITKSLESLFQNVLINCV